MGQRLLMCRLQAPAPTAGADAAALARIDGLMEGLAAKKAEWAALPLREKVGLLQEVRRRLLGRPLEWTKASAQLVKRDTTEVLPFPFVVLLPCRISMAAVWLPASALHTPDPGLWCKPCQDVPVGSSATVSHTLSPWQETWAGELVATITTMTTLIDGYIASLSAFEKTGVFPAPPARTIAGGQTVVQVGGRAASAWLLHVKWGTKRIICC